jgi:hypothetical protein
MGLVLASTTTVYARAEISIFAQRDIVEMITKHGFYAAIAQSNQSPDLLDASSQAANDRLESSLPNLEVAPA